MTDKFFTRLLLLIMFTSLSIWFGGSLVRSALGYELFYNGNKLEIKTEYSNEMQLHTVKLFSYGAAYTGTAYIVGFLCILIFLVKWRGNLKQNGWLFMSIVIFLLSAPIELYLTYLDFELNRLVLFGQFTNFNDPNVQNLFTSRFTKMSLLSPITPLSFVTALFFIIWKPLKLDTSSKEKVDEIS